MRWKGLGAVCIYTFYFKWEKCDRKTAGLSKPELPGTKHACKGQDGKKCKFTSDSLHATFLNCACAMPSPFYLTSHTRGEFYQVPSFSAYLTEK